MSKEDLETDDESNLEQENGINDPQTPAQREVSATLDVPGLIRPSLRSKNKASKLIMTVSAMEIRSNKGNTKM